MLDLNAYKEEQRLRFDGMTPQSRVSFCCAATERLLPLYKAYKEDVDWKAAEPCLDIGWRFVSSGKKPKIPKRVWDGVGELISYYYYEGKPLLLFPLVCASGILDAVTDSDSPRCSIDAARAAMSVHRAAGEVDEALRTAGSPLAGSASVEESEWIEAMLARAASAPLSPAGVDLATRQGLPGWWQALESCANPVRHVKLA